MPRCCAVLSGVRVSADGDRTGWLTMQSTTNRSPHPNSLLTGNLTGNFADSGLLQHFSCLAGQQIQRLAAKFPTHQNREFPDAYQGKFFEEQGICNPEILISRPKSRRRAQERRRSQKGPLKPWRAQQFVGLHLGEL